MAGTLAALPLAIQLDSNARPLDGCLLYLYDAGTSTPAVFYEDFGLTVTLSWPLVGDAAGRIPNFWVADGSYRVRLTDSQGNEIFDINSITAIGPSSGAATGGSSVSNDQIFQTGDPIWLPVSGTRSGWVRGNALTIGSSSSGATERANADCQSLFEYFWNTFSNSLCPVTTGRGSSATNDWNANKRIGTLDMRGITNFGLDTMGNSAANRITGGTSAGAFGGAQTYQLLAADMPTFNTGVESLPHSHNFAYDIGTAAAGGGVGVITGINTGAQIAIMGNENANHIHTVTGANFPFSILPNYRLGSWFFKL